MGFNCKDNKDTGGFIANEQSEKVSDRKLLRGDMKGRGILAKGTKDLDIKAGG